MRLKSDRVFIYYYSSANVSHLGIFCMIVSRKGGPTRLGNPVDLNMLKRCPSQRPNDRFCAPSNATHNAAPPSNHDVPADITTMHASGTPHSRPSCLGAAHYPASARDARTVDSHPWAPRSLPESKLEAVELGCLSFRTRRRLSSWCRP